MIVLSLATAPTSAQRLPHRLHGPYSFERPETLNRPLSSADKAAPRNGQAKPTGREPVRRPRPIVVQNAPKHAPPLPAKLVPAVKPNRNAQTVIRRPAGDVDTTPINATSAGNRRNVVLPPPAISVPSTNEPTGAPKPALGAVAANDRSAAPPPSTSVDTLTFTNETPEPRMNDAGTLDRERFRRRAAEAAQKQMEQIAERLREMLKNEISARRRAEGIAAGLASRTATTEREDAARKRLRQQKLEALEQQGRSLQREINSLTRQLDNERAKRLQIELEKTAMEAALAEAQRAGATADVEALKSKVAELARRLNTSEWARKLAEAQLNVLLGKAGRQPTDEDRAN